MPWAKLEKGNGCVGFLGQDQSNKKKLTSKIQKKTHTNRSIERVSKIDSKVLVKK